MKIIEKDALVDEVVSVLPAACAREVMRIISARHGGADRVSEIQLRACGVSCVRFSFGEANLCYRATDTDIAETVRKITESSYYAYRDTIRKGYLPMRGGIRVGVCAYARSAGSVLTVSEISALIFRIPTSQCDFRDELYEIFESRGAGMLIYSPPGVGKTTALRALCGMLGSVGGYHVVIADERGEFPKEMFEGGRVDVVSGYTRREAIEIAVRTLSPDIIAVDELMGCECEEIMYSVQSGIPVIATAHAKCVAELKSKRELFALIRSGIFKTLVGISREGGKYRLLREDVTYA